MSMTMDNFEDVIFDDDEFLDDDLEPQNNEIVDNENHYDSEDDLTNEVLRLKGISDPDKIKFEDVTGAIIERSWDSLNREEQLNILAGTKEESDYDLDDQEIELINAIRSSGMDVNDYISQLLNSASNTTTQPSYKVNELSDDEVYALDLLEKVGSDNITDEEIEQAINNAKQNESLYKKTVEGIREEYIRLQQDEEAQLANEQVAKQQVAYRNFANSITNEIRGLNSFAGQDLELSNEDAEELASFMLDLDETGVSAFGRALQDPSLFTKAAFWLLNEDQIIEELTKQMQDNYKRGYEAAKADLNGVVTPKVVFNPKTSHKEQNDNFFVEDEDW